LLVEVGRIGRAHGIRGAVAVHAITNVPERRFREGAAFVASGGPRHGETLLMVDVRADPKRWIVRFDGVDVREAAERLGGTVLLAEAFDDPDGDDWWVHDLIGAPVMTVSGEDCGRVTSVLANPASDLLELEGGALVPLTFTVDRRPDGTIVIDPPEGLFDL
jgi:16S rRNA processing protein RimM